MKASVVLALAATALAAPSEIVARNGGGGGGGGGSTPTCDSNQHEICCSGLVGGLLCLVGVLGTGCSGGTYCCSNDVDPVIGALINVNALNCVSIL